MLVKCKGGLDWQLPTTIQISKCRLTIEGGQNECNYGNCISSSDNKKHSCRLGKWFPFCEEFFKKHTYYTLKSENFSLKKENKGYIDIEIDPLLLPSHRQTSVWMPSSLCNTWISGWRNHEITLFNIQYSSGS